MLEHALHALHDLRDVVSVVGITLENIAELLWLAICFVEQSSVKLAESVGTPGRIEHEPAPDRRGAVTAGLAVPGVEGPQAALERGAVEGVVVAQRGERPRPGVGGEPDQLADALAHRLLPSARPEPRLALVGAARQPGARLVRAHPQAEHLERRERFGLAALLPLDQQVGEHAMREQLAVAILHRPGAGDQARFLGERRQQPLREGVDRIDPEPPSRAIEHARKARAGALLHLRRRLGPDGDQVGREVLGLLAHPARQHRVDALGHLGGAGLGEGQAQDLLGRDVGAQQQPQHARG